MAVGTGWAGGWGQLPLQYFANQIKNLKIVTYK